MINIERDHQGDAVEVERRDDRESRRWCAAATVLPTCDPLVGARALGVPSIYWECPHSGEAAAGWGAASIMQASDVEEANDLLSRLAARMNLSWRGDPPEAPPGPWFGGMRFADAPATDATWRGFGFASWTLPEVLAWRVDGGLAVAVFTREGAGAEDRLDSILRRVRAGFSSTRVHPRAAFVELRVSAARQAFEAGVGRALQAIAAGLMQKVVIARSIDVVGSATFDVVEVLARLRQQYPCCVTFLFRAPDGAAFIGATPETLCRVEERILTTEALAGSASPNMTAGLGSGAKERREHQAVVDHIIAVLAPITTVVQVDPAPRVLNLVNVAHLRTGVSAVLREGVDPGRVAAVLHPTPAVGGFPCAAALAFIREHEGVDRGWYAGPVGWIGPGRAHLAVALRSALVRGDRARIFVGAGIVAGSEVASEWGETEIKSLAMMRALGDHVGS